MTPFWPLYVFVGIVVTLVLLMARDIVFAKQVPPDVKVFFSVMALMAVLLFVTFIRSLEHLHATLSLGP